MTPKPYRKRPVSVLAEHWDGTASGAAPIIDWILDNGGTARYHCESLPDGEHPGPDDHVIRITTLEGVMTVSSGDWVIRGVAGEFYPCKPSIFEATYELIYAGEEREVYVDTYNHRDTFRVGETAYRRGPHSSGAPVGKVLRIFRTVKNGPWRVEVQPSKGPMREMYAYELTGKRERR